MRRLTDWLTGKWSRTLEPNSLEDYRIAFNTDSGRRILRQWLDQVYCTVYHGVDPISAAHHNGRRSVIHEILEKLDMADSPEKYQVRQEEEE